MKRFALIISMLVLFAVSFQVTSAANYWDLTSYQQQKYWNMWEQNCQSLLMNQQYAEYLTCALDVMEKAFNLVEAKEVWCSDSDGGIDWLKKGTVTSDLNPGGVEDYIYTFGDGSQYLFEGACSYDNHYFYYQQNCTELGPKYVADVAAGACVLKNSAPVIEAVGDKTVGDKTVKEGELLKFEVKASDADGDSLLWSVEGLPSGAKFDGGVFEWTPGITQAGQYLVAITVDDGMVKVVKQVKITVENLPTEFCGIVSQNTVLTKVQSPYLVKCHILVEKGVTLTIEPGVEVRFDGPYYLRVDGTLKADGTKDQMILFTSNKSDPKPGDWDKIRFEDSSVDWNGTSGSIIRNAQIKYGGSSTEWPDVGVINILSTSPLIESNEISNYLRYGIQVVSPSSSSIINKNVLSEGTANGNGVAIRTQGNSIISNNQIINNNLGQGQIGGIICSTGSSLIKDNYIFKNSGVGIGSGGIFGSCIATIKNNTILNNGGWGIYVGTGAEIISNVVSDNKAAGIYLSGVMSGVIKDINLESNFVSGSDSGIYIQNSQINALKGNVIIKNKKGVFISTHYGEKTQIANFNSNNIYNNSEHAIYLEKVSSGGFLGDIAAQSNYWGTIDTALIDKMIYDYYDDFYLPKVIYKPIVEKPFAW